MISVILNDSWWFSNKSEIDSWCFSNKSIIDSWSFLVIFGECKNKSEIDSH